MYYQGYTVHKGDNIYENLTSETKYLVSSNETAFSVEYLYEISLYILHTNASFFALADVYNQLHCFDNSTIERKNLNRQRLDDGFYLYGLLEMSSRSDINPKFNIVEKWLDEALLKYNTPLKERFSQNWSGNHSCDVENCEICLVSDGGLKIDRSVCAQKFSMLRKIKHSIKVILTGCTSFPSTESSFCPKHQFTESPVILCNKVRPASRQKLKLFRETQSKGRKAILQTDSVYTVESVLARSGDEFLVKFNGFPESVAC